MVYDSDMKDLGRNDCCGAEEAVEVPTPGYDVEVALFKALADPTRFGILSLLLSAEEPVCVCDITSHFPLNQPTISHHLRLLRDAGLVTSSRRGTWAYYSARPERLRLVREAVDSLLREARVAV